MNGKKVNGLFLCVLLVYFFLIIGISVAAVFMGVSIGTGTSLFLIEFCMILPAMNYERISFGISRHKKTVRSFNELLGFHKIHVSTFFMIFLYTFLMMPLTYAVNAISMLFVDNTVSEASVSFVQLPFWFMFLMIAVYGPFCEEFIFRGLIFRGYRTTGAVLGSVLWSALLFGLMHLNFNQAAYAFVIGIFFALLVEATGSLWSSMIAHMVFNGVEVCLMYATSWMESGLDTIVSEAESITTSDILMAIGPYLIAALICTSIAICVLVWMARKEGHLETLSGIWKNRKNKTGYLVSVPLLVAIVLCLVYMCLEVIL